MSSEMEENLVHISICFHFHCILHSILLIKSDKGDLHDSGLPPPARVLLLLPLTRQQLASSLIEQILLV